MHHSAARAQNSTRDELARACGIDAHGLVDTVTAFNRNARRGEDPGFGRGTTPFNRHRGDLTVGPNPSLQLTVLNHSLSR